MRYYKMYFFTLSLITSTFLVSTSVRGESVKKNTPQPYGWVMLGENGQPIVRFITHTSTCPAVLINGKKTILTLRAAPEILDKSSLPSAFPEYICEKTLPVGTKSVAFKGKKLPLPSPTPKRIVILGDTGCRLKKDDAQACNDPNEFPYKKIAQQAALWKPDLVVHLGDYHYRESPCPSNVPMCQNSPWGYGYDTWKADFFDPSRSLLAAAPWVFVRGNHEICERAGRGWWRYLSINPFSPEKSCINYSSETIPDIEDSYRIPLGDDAQFIVWDSSYESDNHPIPPSDPRFMRYQAIHGQLTDLAQRASYSISLSHHPLYPLLTIYPKPTGALGIQSVFKTLNPHLLPHGIQMLMGAHIHLWGQVSFAGDSWPTQFIVGNSGSSFHSSLLPTQLPPNMTLYSSAKVKNFTTLQKEHGFTTLERLGPQKWRVQARSVKGFVRRTCIVEGRSSSCT